MSTVLVTGACGFIGSHLVRQLLSQPSWRVVNLDKLTYAGDQARLADVVEDGRYRFVRGDIADAALVHDLFDQERPWAVVNMAAESHVDRSILSAAPFIQTNVMGTQVLLDAARTYHADRFVQVSTDEVYGDAAEGEPFSEASPLHPSSPYSASKAAADLLCLAYHRTYAMPITIARSANNYGSFQYPEKLIPLMIRNALSGRPLPVYGDGAQVRDWLHVADNCAALQLVMERGQTGHIYNIGAEQFRTNLEVVRMVCQILAEETGGAVRDLEALIQFVPDRPGHDRRYAGRADTIRRELGWIPRMAFPDGLRETVRWYVEHQDWIRRATTEDYETYYESVYRRTWNQPES